MTSSFVIGPLTSHHDRNAFSCGVDSLDRYLLTQAGQDVRRNVANCFVANVENSSAVAGYYTLAAAGIPTSDLPEDLTKRLPRYSVLPAALIGRLAVDQRFRRQSLGQALLFDAARRAIRSDAAVFAILVDAKDETAVAFYQSYQFQSFVSRPMSLFLPVSHFERLFEA